MLGIEDLLDLEDVLRPALDEQLEEILTRLNRTGKLEQFLDLLGMRDLLGGDFERPLDGKIIVIGQSEVPRETLAAVAKSMGFDKERFEFYLDYEDAKTFNFKKTQWSPSYSYILVGPMPHSGAAKGDYSSVITALEQDEGYPPIIRLGNSSLKISKASFREGLAFLKENVA